VRRVLLPAPVQIGAGGVLQAVSVDVYEQLPPEQVPAAEYVRRRLPWQVAPGGVLQVTPEHGSGLHAPPLQPKGHVVSFVV
jgi:hypothetical protein